MSEYIRREEAVDDGYLSDWYIASVGDESPVWTDEHIEELLNDFIVFPKDIVSADVQPVCHGRWIPQGDDMWLCSNCKENIIYSEHESDRTEKQRYCSRCGARMDGGIDG